MISYIKGSLEYLSDHSVIVEAGGIGYQIAVSPDTAGKLPPLGMQVRIYTYLQAKEDNLALFGFLSLEELEMFRRLLSVSGIGPKGALMILSQMTPQDVVMAVLSSDTAALSKAPGVGKKTAQRIVLELKDAFRNEDFLHIHSQEAILDTESGVLDNPKAETIEALVLLGYSRSEAAKAVSSVYQENVTTEELLKMALKKMI